MLYDVGPPTLGVPRRAECLGTNVVFVNTSQNFIFHSSLSFVFPPFSRDISLHLNIVAGALNVKLETLGGRFLFHFAAQKVSLSCLVTPRRLFNTKVRKNFQI